MSTEANNSKNTLQTAFSFKEYFRSIYTPRSSNYASINGIRAISIILVLVVHTFFDYQLAHPVHHVPAMLNGLGTGWPWTLALLARF